MLIPGRYAVAYAEGANTNTDIDVGGILENDAILAVIQWTQSGGEPAGADPGAFTITEDGVIQSSSVSTANKRLCVIYLQAAES